MNRAGRFISGILIGIVLLLSLFTGIAWAEDERILDFNSEIVINQDASMMVTETIKVISTGDQIKHGIYRDFPTQYRDEYGNRVVVEFEVTNVLRDGQPEPFHINDQSNGKRVYIGQEDTLLNPGEHIYAITYRTNRQLGFFADHDELFWNVTGNGWVFPIDRASATVTLPSGTPNDAVKVNGYTGPQGSKAQNYRCFFDGTGRVVFETTVPLNSYEGLTIMTTWPKGLVTEPDQRQKTAWFIRDNLSLIIGLIGLLILLAYYGLIWSWVGKDPPKQTIIPQYTPADGFSPAAMRFITRMGFDQKDFAVAIVNMAVKGYLSISETSGLFKLVKGPAEETVLSPEERLVANELDLGRRGELELENVHHEIFQAAIAKLRQSLKSSCEKTYFVTNYHYFLWGAVASAVAIVGSALTTQGGDKFLFIFMSVWLSFWSVGVYVLLRSVATCWRNALTGGRSPGASLFAAVFLSCFAIPFVIGEIVGICVLSANTPWFTLILILYAGINVLFYHLLKAPTVGGRRLMDEFEGFKMYLETAERDRLNLLNPPDRTPELFERYLPYALALGVEQAWSEQFAGVLAGAGEAGQTYSPAWYSGSHWNSLNTGAFAGSLATSFASAISSASTAPGSGGSGGSGGGGGGGGGGGW